MAVMSGGSYLRHLPNPAEDDPFNVGARAKLDAPDGKPTFDDSSTCFEEWSPEKQRAGYEGALRADEKRSANIQNADDFVVLHPEFVDNASNAKLLTKMVNTMFGDCVHTIPQWEAAYQALLITDSLDIDKAEVAKQQQKAADAQRKTLLKQRQEQERLRNLPEDEMETMSLEQVREQANCQLQEQMQVAGERGGNGW